MSRSVPLSDSYVLSKSQIEFYNTFQYIKLKNVLTPDEVLFYNRIVSEEVERLNKENRPMEERDTYGRAFIQITNLWQHNEDIRMFVFGRRIAEIAANLMDVNRLRLYHDQALFKEAGGGYTPWHADAYYWPLASDKSITAWIPLQETPLEMGALEFSAGSHVLTTGRDLVIGDASEAIVHDALKGGGFGHIIEPFDIGEVSFHAGWTFHRASPNTMSQTRKVMCIIYMDGDMRLATPTNEHQQLDLEVFCPGVEIGAPIQSPLNPLVFERP